MLTARVFFASILSAAALPAQTISTTLPPGSYTVSSTPAPTPAVPNFSSENAIPHDGGMLPGDYARGRSPSSTYFPPCPPILGDAPETGLPNPQATPPVSAGGGGRMAIGPNGVGFAAGLPTWETSPRFLRWQPHSHYPAMLLGHAGTPYFMAYGQLIQSLWPLSPQRLKPIQQSFALRRELFEELHALLETVRAAAPEEQSRRLSELARAQEPKLRELEAGAEAIRVDLTTGGSAAHDPTDSWPVPDLSPPMERALAAFSAAHFQNGFSPAQRALLEEMGLEAWLAAASSPPADATFFWPAGARVRFPTNLSPALTAELADFQQRKAALKQALQAALDRRWNYFRESRRTADYASLAAEQAPAFAALEPLAEQIRRDLAVRPAGPPLPRELAQRAADVVARRAALQREFYARLNEFRRELPPARVEVAQRSDGLAISLATPHGKAEHAADERMRAFSADISARFAAVAADREAVRAALEDYRRSISGPQANLTVDQFLEAFREAYRTRTTEEGQLDYYAAVFLPGLSPAQRRLLLAGVRVSFLREISPAPAAR